MRLGNHLRGKTYAYTRQAFTNANCAELNFTFSKLIIYYNYYLSILPADIFVHIMLDCGISTYAGLFVKNNFIQKLVIVPKNKKKFVENICIHNFLFFLYTTRYFKNVMLDYILCRAFCEE